AAFRPQCDRATAPTVCKRLLEWPIGLGVEWRRRRDHLQVRKRCVRMALDESDQPHRKVVSKSLVQQIRTAALIKQTIVAEHRRKRPGLFAGEHHQDRQVVLQVFPYACESDLQGNVLWLEICRISNTREHEELRRVDDASSQNNLSLRIHVAT